MNFSLIQKIKNRFVSPWCKETRKRYLHIYIYSSAYLTFGRPIDVLRYGFSKKQVPINFKFEFGNDSIQVLETLKQALSKDKLGETSKPHITWIGHATSYYQVDGIYFLTDPVWSSRASPFSFFGPKRQTT
jgi:hypothetical protein